MRVLHVMLSSGLGGVQTAFSNYTMLLSSLGHETICCVAPEAVIAQRLPSKVKVVTLNNNFELDPFAIYRAVRLLRIHKPDILLVHGKRALVIFATARRFINRYIPLVNVLHRHRFKLVSAADISICVSRRLCEEAIACGIDRRNLAYVPNFIPDLWPSEPLEHFHSPPTIGFVGRMVYEKGPDLFIEALKILKDNKVAFRAHIAGDGELKDEMVTLARHRGLEDEIKWFGWIDNLPGFFVDIDICCVPSRSESFGIVLLNAFNSGKALVATRTVGPTEIICDGHNGLLCDVSAVDVALKLKRLIENPPLSVRVAQHAHAERQHYFMTSVAPQVEAILRNAANEHRRNH